MSKIEVDAIDKQSGSTLTLGGSGTAVTLACGATQTGFGREGSVNWQTGSIKTTTFTAANGEGYFADISSGGFTMNLPAGTAGDFDAVIGIRICNTTTSTVLASCQIVNTGNDHFIAKNVSIPPNSAIELIQGGAKIVLENNDLLKAKSNTASSLDIVTSFIDSIST